MASHDVFSPAKRAEIMRSVKSSNTAPERAVRAAVCALGYPRRYRLNSRAAPGKPDLVIKALRKAIFVHGCFWHGHDCKRGAREPKTNAAYWRAKIAANRQRDLATRIALKRAGWSALTIWECETRDEAALKRKLARFLDQGVRSMR
jgi:DNA mismatch endonuclease (patch repair protein)